MFPVSHIVNNFFLHIQPHFLVHCVEFRALVISIRGNNNACPPCHQQEAVFHPRRRHDTCSCSALFNYVYASARATDLISPT